MVECLSSRHLISLKFRFITIRFKAIIPTEDTQTKFLKWVFLIISSTELIRFSLHSSERSSQSNSLSLTFFLSIETGFPVVQLKWVLLEQYFSSDWSWQSKLKSHTLLISISSYSSCSHLKYQGQSSRLSLQTVNTSSYNSKLIFLIVLTNLIGDV